jgi:S1-C subfamily serine protease
MMFGTNLFFSALGAIRQSRRPAWRPVAVTALSLGALAALAGCGASSSPTATVPGQTVSATTLQSRFVAMVGAVSPAVVQIQSAEGLGSGVVFDAHGNVVTNAHVAANQTRFTVTLPSGKHYSATLVGADPASDLAVIHITSATPPAAAFATSSKARVGNIVLAIGNPLGLQSSVSEGIVSSLDRTVSEGNGVTLSSVIQTSAEINPGNSGGALVDLSGRVLGIPTLAALDPELGGAQAPGIGFAISSDTVRRVAGGLIAQARA